MTKSELSKLTDQIDEGKLGTAKIDTAQMSEETVSLISRKEQIYAEVNKLRLENCKVNDELLKRTDAHKALSQLMCW